MLDRTESYHCEGVTEVFRKSWKTYGKVIQYNYLCHTEMKDAFAAHLKEAVAENGSSPPTVLDLGCGDCFLPMNLFSLEGVSPPRRFIGVDMSAEALRVAVSARSNFPDTCDVEFVEADMTSFMESCTESFEIIMSSLAIHHLNLDEKAAMLKSVYARLAPGGLLLWGDVYNSVPGSSRKDTMDRWQTKMETYSGLTAEERDQIWTHASTWDLPEDLPTEEALLKGAGFEDARCVYTDEFYIAVWAARKPATAIKVC